MPYLQTMEIFINRTIFFNLKEGQDRSLGVCAIPQSSRNMAKNKFVKQKTLLPTLKDNQRYIVYTVIDSKEKNAEQLIRKNILSNLGVLEGSKAGIQMMSYNMNKQKGIIRTSNTYVDKVKLSLGLIPEMMVDVTYVTGLLNKAKTKINN